MTSFNPTFEPAFMQPSEASADVIARGGLHTVPTTGRDGAPGVIVEALLSVRPAAVWSQLTDYSQLPDLLMGLRSAHVVAQAPDYDDVRFEVKLPFPAGRLTWTNRIRRAQQGQVFAVSWEYLGGDLEENVGRLSLAPYGSEGEQTFARYNVQVQTRSRLPKSAQGIATRWLLPKVFEGLRRGVERVA